MGKEKKKGTEPALSQNLHFLGVTSALFRATVKVYSSPAAFTSSPWRVQPSWGRVTSWFHVFHSCVLPLSSRCSTSVLQTCLRLTLTAASVRGKLCCWVIHIKWAIYMNCKSTKGQCPPSHLPKIWARRQRARLGGRARQIKYQLLQDLGFFFCSCCFVFLIPGLE